MSRRLSFGGVEVEVPDSWSDITNSLPKGSPFTLTGGQGALQFSIARYQAGVEPSLRLATLRELLDLFASQNGLGQPAGSGSRLAHPSLVWSDYRSKGDFIRTWLLSNGRDITMITFVADESAQLQERELAEAQLVVESLSFRLGH